MTKDEALKMAINTLCNCGLQIGGQALISPYIHETVYVCNEALEQPAEPRLVSYALDGSTCTLNIDGEEVYFNREQPAQDYVFICKRCGDDLGIEYVPDEQPAQEPVGVVSWHGGAVMGSIFPSSNMPKDEDKLYTHPHQWQGLTDNEKLASIRKWAENNTMRGQELIGLCDAIEQALKEKNKC